MHDTDATTTDTSAAALADLGVAVANDGPAAHHRALVRLAHTARRIVGPTAAADVLADPDAPAVVRSRALAVVSSALVAAPPARVARPRRRPARNGRSGRPHHRFVLRTGRFAD